MDSPEKQWDGIKQDRFDRNTEVFPVGTSDDATLGLRYIKTIGVNDSSKLGEVLDFKEYASLGASEYALVGIHEGSMRFCNLR